MSVLVLSLVVLAIVYLVFRLFGLPLKPFWLTAVVFLAIAGNLVFLAMWRSGAPVSTQILLTRPVLEINLQLKGLIKEVNFGIGDSVKAGDVVAQIDPEPFEAAVAQAEAQLDSARSQVDLAQSAVAAAEASIVRAEADAAYARTERERADRLAEQGSSAISELQVEQFRAASIAADAVVEEAVAAKAQAEATRVAAQRGVTVAEQALRSAKFDLGRTRWIAPRDGVLVNWQARENTITTALRSSAIGTFMETGDSRVIAVLPQNMMRKVAVGDAAELAFLSRPGLVDAGKVIRIVKYTGEGQIAGTATVPTVANLGSKGMIAAVIQLDDAALGETLSLGEAGAAAIYTADGGPFAVVSKIFLRTLSLTYFLP